MRAIRRVAPRPFAPPVLRLGQHPPRIQPRRRGQVRWSMDQLEPHKPVRRHHELGHRFHVLAARRHIGIQHREVRPGNRHNPVLRRLQPRHPRHHRSVFKPQLQPHAQRHLAPPPLHNAYHRAAAALRRHEVDHRDHARCGLELGLQHHRPVAVASSYRHHLLAGANLPAPVLRPAQQRRKARRAVKPRPAQPVHRPRRAHQRRAVPVGQQCILLYAGGYRRKLHLETSRTPCASRANRIAGAPNA